MAEQALPRLAYIGDVGICDRGNGPRILKTLLEAYPAEKLSLHISDFWVWPDDDRLPGVVYERFRIRWQRLKMGRLYGWMTTQCLLASRKRAWALARALRPFEPQGIFTVTAGPSWLLAAHTARLLNIPLHLILHDDLRTGCAIAPGFDKWLARQFHDVYVQASSRLCVSPYMEECYRGRFGVPGTVLYPNRSCDEETNVSPLSQRTSKQFTVAYAGNISSKHYVAVLARLANALREVNGRLLIYALTDKNAPHLAMLDRPDVEIRDRVSSHELRQRLAGEADVLFVPMSFAGADEMNMHISFPSKLANYTGLGLPVLILGPRHCAAVRWANEFRDAAIAIDAPDDDSELVTALKRLAGDPEYRRRFAKGAIVAGNACFAHRKAFQVFSEAVRTETLGESQLPPAERPARPSRSWVATS